MKISAALYLVIAATGFPNGSSRVAGGDDAEDSANSGGCTSPGSRELGSGERCFFDSAGSKLRPKKGESYFERGVGICSGKWGFGLTERGRLRLYEGKRMKWDSGKSGMDYCNMNRKGAFACYRGEPLKPLGGADFALNCGGTDGSFMKIDEDADPVVQKKNDVKSWGIEKDGDVVGTCVSSSGDTELTLFAKYDWKKGARDVSGSRIRHDGVLDRGATIKRSKLRVKDDHGVDLGIMPELKRATKVLLQFEDLTFPDLETSWSGQYCVLIGGGYEKWWVGVDYDFPDDPINKGEEWYNPKSRTTLVFNVGGFGRPRFEHKVVVADELVTHFDKIEYRFDGTKHPGKRLAIRYNGGKWTEGGWKKSNFFRSFPDSDKVVRINDGARADWDQMVAKFGPVSLWAI